MDQWVANMEYLKPMGYDYMIFSSLPKFKKRVKDKLGVEAIIKPGEGKVWDYRPMLGVLFEEELKGYDYWGHTDFDVVYGRIDQFMDDDLLDIYDIWSNHHNYICGFWTLYRNTDVVNNLFKKTEWEKVLANPTPTGWAEKEYTRAVDLAHNMSEIELRYTYWQGKDPNIDTNLEFKNGILTDAGDEIMTYHFRRTKRWPIKDYV